MRRYFYGASHLHPCADWHQDENGSRFATFEYDAGGKAISTEHFGGVGRWTATYTTNAAQITDPRGTVSNWTFQTIQGVARQTSASQPCSSCGNAYQSKTYDANANVTSRTDFNGKKACFAFDLARNLETARIEGLTSAEDCTAALASPPNRVDVRKVATTWHATYRLPATITEPAPGGTRTTTFTYDALGNLLQRSIAAPKNDGTSATITRAWNWTYAPRGRALTAADPNGNVTTTTYYPDNDPDIGKRGNVATVTNAAGHVTAISAYDAAGRPLSITDPNGMATTMAYDARGSTPVSHRRW